MRWGADYLDPENFLTMLLTTKGPENKSGFSNLEADALCAKADVMADGDERNATYAKAEDLFLQDAFWLPLYFQRDAELISSRVKNLRGSVFGHLPHTTVEIAAGQ
jgi:ABC-type oligopeptide transport system substrate-binding subunit